jgi:hypothetical protein
LAGIKTSFCAEESRPGTVSNHHQKCNGRKHLKKAVPLAILPAPDQVPGRLWKDHGFDKSVTICIVNYSCASICAFNVLQMLCGDKK